MINYKQLAPEDARKLAEFEASARTTEPGVLFREIDIEQYAQSTRQRFCDQLCANTRVFAAFDEEKIVGRLDVVLMASLMDDSRTAYVDWVYVLKPYRNQKIAKGLFTFMEKYLQSQKVSAYFLVTAHNEQAQKFYNSFQDIQKDTDWILRKDIPRLSCEHK